MNKSNLIRKCYVTHKDSLTTFLSSLSYKYLQAKSHEASRNSPSFFETIYLLSLQIADIKEQSPVGKTAV